MVNLGFIKNIDNKKVKKKSNWKLKRAKNEQWHVISKKNGILTSVDLSIVSMINYNHQL